MLSTCCKEHSRLIFFVCERTQICKKWSTLHSRVNLCLSSGGLPRAPGYSQSRSRPSKPWLLRNVMEDWIKVCLFSDVDTMILNLKSWQKIPWRWNKQSCSTHILHYSVFEQDSYWAEPKFHPPTAKRVFKLGFLSSQIYVALFAVQIITIQNYIT